MATTIRRTGVDVPDVFTRGMAEEPRVATGSGGFGSGELGGYDGGDRHGPGDDDRGRFERLVAVAALAAAGVIMTTALVLQSRSMPRR